MRLAWSPLAALRCDLKWPNPEACWKKRPGSGPGNTLRSKGGQCDWPGPLWRHCAVTSNGPILNHAAAVTVVKAQGPEIEVLVSGGATRQSGGESGEEGGLPPKGVGWWGEEMLPRREPGREFG